MRALPVLAAGAFMLTVGLADPAAAAVIPSPTPTPSVTATPTPLPTVSATPTAPVDEVEIVIGEYTSTPETGPAGTVVTLTSGTPCVTGADDAPGQVEVVLVDTADLEEEIVVPVVDKIITAGAEGDWTTTVTIPADAPDGVLFGVGAGCFGADEELTPESVPTVLYTGASFTVAAPTAPVAVPVVGTPTFTG